MSPVAAIVLCGVVLLAGLAMRRLIDGADIGRRWGCDLDEQYHESWRDRP